MEAITEIKIRTGRPTDYDNVIAAMPEWWGGRDLTAMLPKVFFIHFHRTIFIAELKGELVGFLVGFFSQSDPQVGYIHFVGVHPNHRKAGIGRRLYYQFYDACQSNHRSIIKSCTSPINKLSIDFHSRMGFMIESGDGIVGGVCVTKDFLRKNDPKVLFKKELDVN